MDASQYLEKIITNDEFNFCEDLTGKVSHTLDEIVEATIDYYSKNLVSERVIAVRKSLCENAREFHNKAGTYSDKIEKAINDLSDPDTLIVEVAHQPNIFPYGGFFKKIVMGHLIAERIRQDYEYPVVELFGIVNQDLASPKWFRSTYLPEINSREGFLVLEAPISRESTDAMYTISKPSPNDIDKWKNSLRTWLANNSKILNRNYKEVYNSLLLDHEEMSTYWSRLGQVFELIDQCAYQSESLSEFNSFFVSKITNSLWDYPMLFYEYHSTQFFFSSEYLDLSRRFIEYHESFNKIYSYLNQNNISLNFNIPPKNQAPFWIHCECGAKVEASLCIKNEELCVDKFRCLKCGKDPQSISIDELFDYKEGDFSKNISPRAVSRPLIVSSGINPSVFVSGSGAFGFEMISRGIANEFGIKLPPYVIWNSKDICYGIAQKVAEQKINKIKNLNDKKVNNQKMYEKYLNVVNVIPCIIDYWVNFGILNTKKCWETHILFSSNFNDTIKMINRDIYE